MPLPSKGRSEKHLPVTYTQTPKRTASSWLPSPRFHTAAWQLRQWRGSVLNSSQRFDTLHSGDFGELRAFLCSLLYHPEIHLSLLLVIKDWRLQGGADPPAWLTRTLPSWCGRHLGACLLWGKAMGYVQLLACVVKLSWTSVPFIPSQNCVSHSCSKYWPRCQTCTWGLGAFQISDQFFWLGQGKAQSSWQHFSHL